MSEPVTSQSLLHHVICSHVNSIMTLTSSRPRRNPFFISSFVPTSNKDYYNAQQRRRSQSLLHQVICSHELCAHDSMRLDGSQSLLHQVICSHKDRKKK